MGKRQRRRRSCYYKESFCTEGANKNNLVLIRNTFFFLLLHRGYPAGQIKISRMTCYSFIL